MAEWEKTVQSYLEEKVELLTDTAYLTAIGQLSELKEVFKRKQACFESLITESKDTVTYKFYGENIPKIIRQDKTKRELSLIMSDLEKVISDIEKIHLMIIEQQRFVKKYKKGKQ